MTDTTDPSGPAAGVPSATSADPGADDLAKLVRDALRAELDQVLPHVVSALKRQEAVAALTHRLEKAETRLAERQSRPLIAGLRRALTTVRRLQFDTDAKSAILAELEALIVGAGYTEFGEIGEPFDPRRQEALSGDLPAEGGVVAEVLEPGLETLGEVVVPARVRIGRNPDERGAPQ